MTNITFTPDLQATPIPISPNGDQKELDLTFRATFDTREAYERAKRKGTRVEMWTNLQIDASVSQADQGWHALSFVYTDEALVIPPSISRNDVLSVLPPSSTPTNDQASRSAYLTINVPVASVSIRNGAQFSFTYRLVEASGAIIWLGQYGKNGVLNFVKRDAFADLTYGRSAGCVTTENDGNVVIIKELPGDLPGVREIGRLDKDLHWERWAIGPDGCVPLHT